MYQINSKYICKLYIILTKIVNSKIMSETGGGTL
jgi:hypothetical protein